MPDIDSLVAGSREAIVIADDGSVRFVIFNRPRARNALTRAMRADFSKLLRDAESDTDVEALVVTGAGNCFCAGVDLKDRVEGLPPVEPNPGAALRSFAKPLIAAVDGPCLTGGLEIMLACDFAIATPTARFADTHCRLGFFPRWGGGAMLASAVGVRRARQLMLTNSFVDGPTALAWGLVNELVSPETLLKRATELAGSMAAQAREQPLSYRLHARMLSDMGRLDHGICTERDALAQFDAERRSAQ